NPLKTYWTIESQEARKIMFERAQQALLTDDFDQKDLIQVNVTGVYSRFCDVPMANNFFTNVKSPTFNRYPDGVRTDWPNYHGNHDWKEPPKNPGWAVEIRGNTYQKNSHYFVAHTLVETLKTHKSVAWPLQSPTPQATPLETSHIALLKYEKVPITGNA